MYVSSPHRLHSNKHLKLWKEKKGNSGKYYICPLKRRLTFSFCSIHWFNFCEVRGGVGGWVGVGGEGRSSCVAMLMSTFTRLWRNCASACISNHFGRRLSCSCTKSTVKAFVFSHLEYYNAIWRETTPAAEKPVSVLYNSAARLILQCDYKTHHSELYSKLNWFPPSAKPEYYLAQIVYKCRKNTRPTNLNDRLQKASTAHSINTPCLLLMTPATFWKQTLIMVNTPIFFSLLLTFNLLGRPATAKNFPNPKNNLFSVMSFTFLDQKYLWMCVATEYSSY